ncbi:hypothetical protein Pth03_42310 [Planotetraspora thailandica]|uniref:Methyltransferase domain-containing protein n=1 Tax=Planotetraspora thailandica TaxID=487172 RepID=A0A8J3V5B7_9ACTN|nr:class I SAM-dependent methyltransferase [Planotetraspora thailandica]GII55842.1 hypothetical protein Pth03_42310 [Planotetraspora thailandica]
MTGSPPPERLVWAVETLDLSPSDRVLEIGCGRGVAVALVGERLAGGTVTGIDRSATAIGAAGVRNAMGPASGKVRLATTALEEADFGDGSFDKIFAVNVNLFWTRSPARELALLRRWLAPGGVVHLYWEPPGSRAAEIAEKVSAAAILHGFEAQALFGATTTGTRLVCVQITP